MPLHRLLALIPLMLALGCGSSKAHLDSRTAGILAGATKVEVYRIDGRDDPPDPTPIKPGDPTVGGYAILSRGPDQGADFTRRLADILTDETTYSDRFSKCFWPGVAFRVYQGDECVDMVICFRCHNFYLGPPSDKRVMETASFASTPAVERIVRLAKDAFPDDPEIQALEEK